MDAIQIYNVTKRFGKKDVPWWHGLPLLGNASNGDRKSVTAVDDVTLSVQTGEIFGVLGPNGSGKSTLIRLIATLLLPDEGELRVFGHDVVRAPREVQQRINRVSVEASFLKRPTRLLAY